jgi:alpha-L-rhamnosidase
MKLKAGIVLLANCFTLACSTLECHASDPEKAFRNPPESARPGVLWMWMGNNLSQLGITRDLEALKDAGFNRTTMFSLADTTTPWAGEIDNSPTPEMISWTEPWWKLVRHAAVESKRLGMDFGMFNGPGYESSGGPWITPEHSMQEVCFSQTPANGPGRIALNLPQPTVDPRAVQAFPVFNPGTGKVENPETPARKTFYRDIAVLAMPAEGVVAKDQVIDLTGKTDWEAPDGKWMIYRFGHTTMGTLIQPAQWKAVGLECDKMNPEAVKFHLTHVIGEIQSHLGDLIGTGFTHVHFDSYEAGVPGWTPRMREEFSKRRGYELTPFLATLAKRTVGSEEETRKFQSDFLDTIKDLYRDVYFATIQQMLHAAKLTFLCEPYGGPWRQDEILPKIDRVMTEFWTNDGRYAPFEVDPTIAALRKSGQNIVEAEAFTGLPGDSRWSETPAWLKPIGDAAYCAGINRFILHRFAQQPWDERYKPGAGMGCWGTHFDRTQTWWEPGKALVQYWQRCQALLQWGQIAPLDFSVDGLPVTAIHRRREGADLWFVANPQRTGGEARCVFKVTGKQPELWDPVTGEMRDLPEYQTADGQTELKLKFDAAQSFFVVFRKPGNPSPGTNFPALAQVAEISGPWEVRFDPKWGGPASVKFDKLTDWTKHPEPGIRYYSGTATYQKTFDGAAGNRLDLGVVNHLARVRLNGRDLGVVWTAPWQVGIPAGLLKPTGNQLEIEVTNVWANRLIGDEQEPADCEWSPGHHFKGQGGFLKRFPEWFVENKPRPAQGRYCFTTWNYFTKDSPLVPSGLIGPVTLQCAQ